jgi:hypothetical protein
MLGKNGFVAASDLINEDSNPIFHSSNIPLFHLEDREKTSPLSLKIQST